MKIYLVGGAVRDELLGKPIKERDYVVVGASVEDMLKLGYRQVGKEFPVFLHPKTNEEYALARMERKVKPGYKGFTFDASQDVSLKDDLIRRDLTINAMAKDLITGEIVDPYGGQRDIQDRKLRHVSDAFSEDPVRILRVGRFYARFAADGFSVDEQTIKLMQNMVKAGEVDALVAERVWKELYRALKESQPDKFFEVLHLSHALPILFPHLFMEGRGIAALNVAAKLSDRSDVRLAALLHDYPPNANTDVRKESILQLCQRYKVPNRQKKLASLVSSHYQQLFSLNNQAEKILDLFYQLDTFRRYERFEHFVSACLAIAAVQKQNLDEKLLLYAQLIKEFSIQDIIATQWVH